MGRTWFDSSGRQWFVALDAAAVRMVEQTTGVNLLSDFAAVAHAEKFAQVMFVLCERQAERRKMTPEEFALALASASEKAAQALIAATKRAMRENTR
jgi:hypothetical protein